MKIIETEIFEENGVKYQRDIYENGATVTYPWVDPDAPIPEPEPEPEQPTTPNKEDQIILGITDLYEQNSQLHEDNVAVINALTDLYELSLGE